MDNRDLSLWEENRGVLVYMFYWRTNRQSDLISIKHKNTFLSLCMCLSKRTQIETTKVLFCVFIATFPKLLQTT